MFLLLIRETPNGKDWDRLIGGFTTKTEADDYAIQEGDHVLQYKIIKAPVRQR
jgi:hypothetical protein